MANHHRGRDFSVCSDSLLLVLFIGQQAWLSTWVGAVGVAPDNVATYAKAVSWLVGIAVFLVSAYVLGKVPKWLQLLVTYLELLMLLVLFMTTFNIDMDFILRKLPFLITQGAFTTLYVTVVSIALAFVWRSLQLLHVDLQMALPKVSQRFTYRCFEACPYCCRFSSCTWGCPS